MIVNIIIIIIIVIMVATAIVVAVAHVGLVSITNFVKPIHVQLSDKRGHVTMLEISC